MPEAKITVYGAPWCPDCKRSKQFLGEQRVPYDWVDIDQDDEGRGYVQRLNDGKQIIPTIVFEDGSILVEPTDAELARNGLDLMFLGGMFARQCPVHQRGMTGQVRILLEQHDAQGWLGLANAGVGLDLPVDHAKQRGLAHPVAPDQRDPVARSDMQVQRIVIGPAEQPFAALLQGDAFEAENWGGPASLHR